MFDICSIDVQPALDRCSIDFRGLEEGWRSTGGGLEGHWKRIGLEEDWRIGGRLEEC